jgi:SAM-dependent methyltransferase
MSTRHYERYWEFRKSRNNLFGYGLARRIEQLVSLVHRMKLPAGRVVDMGCADGAMLKALCGACQVGEAIGFDVFEHGEAGPIRGVKFIRHDLYTQYPFPCADGSVDLVIVSAFYKHHPAQLKFLAECNRLLAHGGAIVFLEPRRWVVRIGLRLGYFNPASCPHPWTRRTLAAQLGERLRITVVENYWVAPVASLYWIERLMPAWLKRLAGLHQSIIVQRCCTDASQAIPGST